MEHPSVEELLRLLKESQQREQEADTRAKELQQQKQEADIRSAENIRLREEAQQREQEAETRAAEQTELRRKAESITQETTITQYLEGCHEISRAIKVITDCTLTTQGDAGDPTGRVYPRRILLWPDFAAQQQRIWEQLAQSPSFSSQKLFPSLHQLQLIRRNLKTISSESDVRFFDRDAIESPVQHLVEAVYNDEKLREVFNLTGTVTFESHTNLGDPATADAVAPAMEQMSISKPTEHARGANVIGGSLGQEDTGAEGSRSQVEHMGKSIGKGKSSIRQTAAGEGKRSGLQTRGKGGHADNFCIYRQRDGPDVPILGIEQKPPHKVTVEEIVAGLASPEIVPARDIINQEGDDFEFLCKSLLAAVITQLFSYMIGKGLKYGFISTGEAYIFLRIPDHNPTEVYYSLCVPSRDVEVEEVDNKLHRTAVAQVFAFTLNALAARPVDQAWYDATKELDLWDVEYIDILKKIPESVRKERNPSAYKPCRWKVFVRTPIRTRASCRETEDYEVVQSETDSDSEGPPPTPSRSLARAEQTNVRQNRSTTVTHANDRVQTRNVQDALNIQIQDRPYCSPQCLLGLRLGSPLDERCPNVHDHKAKHIKISKFRKLVRKQLAEDRGPYADSTPLYVRGARGALFKIRLSSYGYTFVAKGMEAHNVAYLQHEEHVYAHINTIQGQYVPVCLGAVDLLRPYYYDCRVYVRILLLSWAGKPIFNLMRPEMRNTLQSKASEALRALHKFQVLHKDPRPANMLMYGERLMLVDFERAEMFQRQPLSSTSANRMRIREGNMDSTKPKDNFSGEVQSARAIIARGCR